MSNDANDPAYPVVADNGTAYASAFRGLSKREAFAMAAMQGMRAAMPNGRADYEAVARAAVNQADYLLDELAK